MVVLIGWVRNPESAPRRAGACL